MENELQSVLDLPPVSQIGFVVKDLEQAIIFYTPLFGEFRTLDAFDLEWEYRGRPEVSSIKVAFAQSGDVEIELIEWVSGETPHKEFLEAGREGLHHVRFLVDDMDEKIRSAKAFGYAPIWHKRFAPGLAAAYLEREGDPLLIEFYEAKFGFS